MKKAISFSSNINNLDKAEKFVNTICDFEEVDEKYFGNILIAITEGVTNAIEHGNKCDPSKVVSLQYYKENNSLGFVVEDQGPGFNHETLPDPTLPENLEKETGRGIFLMKSLADDVTFENDGRKIKLIFLVSNG